MKKWLEKIKNLSWFQIVAIVLIALLFVANIIMIGVMIDLNDKMNDLNKKNQQLEQLLPPDETENTQFIISLEK